MLTFAICDDELTELRKTERLLNAFLQSRPELSGQISLFSSASELLDAVSHTGSFDFYILDILMPGMTGIELGRILRRQGDTGKIIYLTTSPDYAVDSYDTDAFFYLVKPVEKTRFFEILSRAACQQKKQDELILHTRDGMIRLPANQVLYAEQLRRVIQYHLEDGSVLAGRTLRVPFAEAAAPLLADRRFLLCGSSYVLNLNRIREINRTDALFDTDDSLPLPRTQRNHIRQKWIEYWLEGVNRHEI